MKTMTFEQYRELESTVIDLTLKLERAACLIEDLTENYFSCALTRDDLWKFELGFHEHRIKSDIIWDYVYDSKQLAEQVEKLLVGGLLQGEMKNEQTKTHDNTGKGHK